ncbi:MAG TPA: hypothetical protein PKM25_05440 [Candidatus Ozemobacteraceae bacterium]|nr:hypothetical protein [Candidatus Ozemobacteraceae bacterium]
MQCGLSDAQQKRVLEPVLDFAAKIREERYSLPSGLGLIRRFDRGPLFATLFLSGLASRLQEQGEAGETVGASSTRMTALFLEVYRQNPVASATLTSLQELVTIKQELTFRRPSGLVIRTMAPVMKPDLTPEERASALALMQSAIAGAGNRPETPLRIDPVAAVTEAIQGVLGEENTGSTSAERNQ